LVRVFGLGNGLPIVLTVFLLVFEEEALSSAGVSEFLYYIIIKII